MELPQLPEPSYNGGAYTDDEMRSYAAIAVAAAIAEEREACAKLCEERFSDGLDAHSFTLW